jgi:hypothetical protein
VASHDLIARAALLLAALITLGCGQSSSSPASVDAAAEASAAGGGGPGTGGTAAGAGGYHYPGAGGAGGGVSIGGDCRSNDDCASAGALCLAPGESPGCGVCKQATFPCSADADCAARGPSAICDLDPCSCDGQKSCVTGCPDGVSCGPGQFCTADHRCANNVCTPGDQSCLPDFVCGSDGHCTRKPCTTGADCDGACVKGFCYLRPGTCTPPSA